MFDNIFTKLADLFLYVCEKLGESIGIEILCWCDSV